MGRVKQMDVAGLPPRNLVDAMQAAADRDMVARQYVDGFATILEEVVPLLLTGAEQGWSLTDRIIWTHLQLLHRYGDSLIARKCGEPVASEAARRAALTIDAAGTDGAGIRGQSYLEALSDFDFWLALTGIDATRAQQQT